jgi:plasmid stabilization system protein ParE
MRVEYHPSTVTDVNNAVKHYEDLRPGLGADVRAEIYSAIDRVIGSPHRYRRVEGEIRRCFVQRFPYSVLYRFVESEDLVRILIVRHHRQRSSFGLSRQ